MTEKYHSWFKKEQTGLRKLDEMTAAHVGAEKIQILSWEVLKIKVETMAIKAETVLL